MWLGQNKSKTFEIVEPLRSCIRSRAGVEKSYLVKIRTIFFLTNTLYSKTPGKQKILLLVPTRVAALNTDGQLSVLQN